MIVRFSTLGIFLTVDCSLHPLLPRLELDSILERIIVGLGNDCFRRLRVITRHPPSQTTIVKLSVFALVLLCNG
jgi:hypothetical protein